MDRISIITVVYNDAKNIQKTLDSIINQTYPNLQYIIIDGKSSDGTREIIEQKIKQIANITQEINGDDFYKLKATKKDNPTFDFEFISQKDGGIYDAMNKGIELANGKWCNFMNSGDVFYRDDTIAELFARFTAGGGQYSVIYGNTQVIYDETNTKIMFASHNHRFHHRFIHQSSFVQSDVMKELGFDTSFKIAGDTNLFTMLYNSGHKFCYIDIIVSSFCVDGVSSKITYQMFKEDCRIGYKYNRLFPIFHTMRFLFRDVPRYIIRISLPKKIQNKVRVIVSKKRS